MMLKKIQEFFTKNIVYKISALVCAIILWLFCMNMTNPTSTKLYNVRVTFLNEASMEKNNIILQNYDALSNLYVSVRINANKATHDAIGKSENKLKATVNLELLEILNPADIGSKSTAVTVSLDNISTKDYHVNQGDFNIVDYSPKEVDLLLDRITEKAFDVKIVTGNPAEGYSILNSTPERVILRGAATTLARVSAVRAEADVSGKTEDVTTIVLPMAYDMNNNPIRNIEINPSQIKVTIPIRKEGVLSVKQPEIQGQPAEGYILTEIKVDPPKINILGKEEDLKLQTNITLAPINITGFTESTTIPFDIRPYLDSKLSIVNGVSNEVNVHITIERLVNKTFEINVSDINTRGLSANYTTEFPNETVSVTIQGAESAMVGVAQQDIKGSVNISGLEPGTHSIPVSFILPKNIRIVDDLQEPTLTVTILEKAEAESEVPEENDTGASDIPVDEMDDE